jgi:hypothetical protein
MCFAIYKHQDVKDEEMMLYNGISIFLSILVVSVVGLIGPWAI